MGTAASLSTAPLSGSALNTQLRYDQKRNSVATPIPMILKTLLWTGLFQPNPYVAVYRTPVSMTAPTALNSRNSVSSRVRPLLSRSRYVQ